MSDLDEVLQAYYAEEINVSISSFFDQGWVVQIGDEVNGYKTRARFKDVSKIAPWLLACLDPLKNGTV